MGFARTFFPNFFYITGSYCIKKTSNPLCTSTIAKAHSVPPTSTHILRNNEHTEDTERGQWSFASCESEHPLSMVLLGEPASPCAWIDQGSPHLPAHGLTRGARTSLPMDSLGEPIVVGVSARQTRAPELDKPQPTYSESSVPAGNR